MNTQEEYEQLYLQAAALLDGDEDLISRMANLSSLLYHSLKHVNWAGFYRFIDSQLILGPFQGKPACTPIPLGKGVCGCAALQKETLCVKNVHEFPGHIACDAASQSEIVVPILKENTIIGVLDIDSDIIDCFNETDCKYLSMFVSLLINDESQNKK